MAQASRSDLNAWALSALATVLITVLFLLWSPTTHHYMVLPTALCGLLIGVDVARWALGHLDALDPQALIGVFGYHFFFLAPLLHVAWDHWPSFVVPASDWRHSLAVLGFVNLGGLLIYRVGMGLPHKRRVRPARQLDVGKYKAVTALACAVSLATFGVVVATYGGPSAYLRTVADDTGQLSGRGPLLILGEAWPLLLYAGFVIVKRDVLRRNRLLMVLVLLGFVITQFLTAGLRGSRANTIWPTLIAVVIAHLVVTRVRKRSLLIGGTVLLAFMFVYGIYKSTGTEFLEVFDERVAIQQVADETGRTEELVLLEDLGRSGTQALIIDRYGGASAPGLALGSGYVGDVLKYAPDSFGLSQVQDKVALGSSYLHGTLAYEQGRRSSRIYGLVGEGIMNFGLYGAALVFIPFTYLARRATSFYRHALAVDDLPARLMAPVWSITAILALGSDVDNLVWFLLKHALPLGIVVWACSQRPIDDALTAPTRQLDSRSGRR